MQAKTRQDSSLEQGEQAAASLYSALAQNERGFKLLMACLVLVTAGSMFLAMQWHDTGWRRLLLLAPETNTEGDHVFRSKGCVRCHAVAGMGGKTAPDFAGNGPDRARLPQLVIAMWNHIPRMRQQMQANHVAYPVLTYNETAQLFSFFFSLSRLDRVGDPEHGQQVFEHKGCVDCHSIAGRGGKLASDLSKISHADKVEWAQSMLSHAPVMYRETIRLGMTWPQFQRTELNDLLTYVQQASEHMPPHPHLLTGDPDAGWQVYQSKSCLVCHSVKDQDMEVAPSLGPATRLPASASGIAAIMWNKFPRMYAEIEQRDLAVFSFRQHELSDLISFIQSLRYIEPTGSPQVGQTVFVMRGCGRCHGNTAEGTGIARALRGQGRIYNSISLAAALWRHGASMYQQSQQMSIPWPTLQESDVGDILAFLNAPARRINSAAPAGTAASR